MSPASAWPGNLKQAIGVLLCQHLPGGKVINEAPVRTSEGVRVDYVAWISRRR